MLNYVLQEVREICNKAFSKNATCNRAIINVKFSSQKEMLILFQWKFIDINSGKINSRITRWKICALATSNMRARSNNIKSGK